MDSKSLIDLRYSGESSSRIALYDAIQQQLAKISAHWSRGLICRGTCHAGFGYLVWSILVSLGLLHGLLGERFGVVDGPCSHRIGQREAQLTQSIKGDFDRPWDRHALGTRKRLLHITVPVDRSFPTVCGSYGAKRRSSRGISTEPPCWAGFRRHRRLMPRQCIGQAKFDVL
jgi:hypothetical protein